MKKLVIALCIIAPGVGAQQSRLGTYTATTDVSVSGELNRDARRATISVLQGDSRLYEIVRQIPYDVAPPAIGLFESGSLILMHAFSGTVEFVDANGISVRTLKPLPDAGPDHERVISFGIHDTVAALLVADPLESSVTYLSVTHTGEVTTRKEFPGQFANAVLISNRGTVIAAGISQWEEESVLRHTHLVDKDGIVRASLDVGCEGGLFSPDDSLLLLTTTHQAAIIDQSTFSTVASFRVPDGFMIHDGIWAGGSFYVLSSQKPQRVNGDWVYSGPMVQRMDAGKATPTVRSYPTLRFKVARLKELGQDVLLELDGIDQSVR